MPVVNDYTAIVSGSSWRGGNYATNSPAFVTYSFETAVQPYLTTGNFTQSFLNSFVAFTETEKAAARAAMAQWADASGLVLLEVQAGEGDIRFGSHDFTLDPNTNGFTGYGFYPGTDVTTNYAYRDNLGGDVFIDHGDAGNTFLLLHEIGHALGFQHPFGNSVTLPPELNNQANTVMSYTGNSPSTLGVFDLQAVAAVYGGAGSDGTQVQSWSWNAAERILTQTGFSTADRIFGVGVRDIIYGGGGDDLIGGFQGNDILDGGAGNDIVFAGEGLDLVYGSAGTDYAYGEAGFDYLTFNGLLGSAGTGLNIFMYGAGSTGAGFVSGNLLSGAAATVFFDMEVLTGTEGIDTFFADSNFASTADGKFQWVGAAGNDSFTYANGTEIRISYLAETLDHNGNGVWGDGAGEFGVIVNLTGSAVTANIGNGSETVQAGGGRDTYLSTDTISGLRDFILTDARDYFAGGNAGMIAAGLGGNDTMIGGQAADALFGDNGDDQLYGNNGLDQIYGGGGLDYISGGADADYLSGGSGRDVFFGGAGVDTIIGGAGDDEFYVLAGDGGDIIVDYVGQGLDRIFTEINYWLSSGSEIETLSTTANVGIANINLTGNTLNNVIVGNNGVNLLDGGLGNDTLYGIGGAIDYFAFSTLANSSTNFDVIADWSSAGDLIMLDDAAFAGMAAGFLTAAGFVSGAGLTSAATAAQRVIHNNSNGDLWYDLDGSGGLASVRFANIGAANAIFYYDFYGI